MQNLFTILDLPVAFALNLKTLEQKYFAAQRQWHPDRFIGKGEDMRGEAALRSVAINDAYDTLKNPLTRAQHMLALQGVLIDDSSTPPTSLLMEIMDLRERIHDHGEDGRGLLTLVEEMKKMLAVCSDAIADAFATSDIQAAHEEVLRMGYLGKAMEEAHMLLYRIKSRHGNAHS